MIVRVNGEDDHESAVGILIEDPNFDSLLVESGIPIFFLRNRCYITRAHASSPKSRLIEAARDNWSKDISTKHRYYVTKDDELGFNTVSAPFHDSNVTDATSVMP